VPPLPSMIVPPRMTMSYMLAMARSFCCSSQFHPSAGERQVRQRRA
jgi:hypothetical protein